MSDPQNDAEDLGSSNEQRGFEMTDSGIDLCL